MLIHRIGILLIGAALFASGAAARDAVRELSTAVKSAETRTALVIGNASYLQGPLKNPVNDARAMASALAESGFDVILVEDATQGGMKRAIRRFGDRISKGGVGLFYYAGHGMQSNGRNFLVPVNADIDREYEIEFSSVDVDLVLKMMDAAKNSLNIVILDACRTNPFARSFSVAATGLAQMDAPSGTFIAFATAPGRVAWDGTGENGIYTKHLLDQIRVPGVPIERLFKQVRIGVMTETKGSQTPWESSSLSGEFAFRPGSADSQQDFSEALRQQREAQRAEMDKMIEEALARQRRQFEEMVKVLPPAGPATGPAGPPGPMTVPLPVPASKPPAVASIKPPDLSTTRSRLPSLGDTWTYRLTQPRHRGSQTYVARVLAASGDAILDHVTVDNGRRVEWAHLRGGYLVSQGASIFSPYLAVFDEALKPGTELSNIALRDLACKSPYTCTASGKILGTENISVPAGRFEAIKVVIDHMWLPFSGASMNVTGSGPADMIGGRTLTVWYSARTKRAIKYSSRLVTGNIPPVEAAFDLELVSYELK